MTDCAHGEIHGYPAQDTPDWVGTLYFWCPIKQTHYCDCCEMYEEGEPRKVRDDADGGL